MMFEFSSTLFWYKLLFMAEIIVAEAALVKNLRRRDNFTLRVFLCVVALFLISFLMPIVAYATWWTIIMFFLLFFFSLFALKICFKESWWNVVFCGLAAYTIQHISYIIFSSVNDILSIALGETNNFNPYIKERLGLNYRTFLSAVIYLCIYGIAYTVAYFEYSDRINPDEVVKLGRAKFVVLAGIIIITDNIFNAISIYYQDMMMISFWIERGYNILTCMLSLQLQFSQLVEKEMETELKTVQHILFEEKKQYEIIKNNINTLNIKCHDMKHQLYSIKKNMTDVDQREINEMEEALMIYETIAKTGNETLDIILTEKNLMYSKDNVKITCIADGAQLNFIYPSDLYSLFGNAIDNSIEAVINLEESKRNISVLIKSANSMVSIHIENYFAGELKMHNGFPVTGKRDKIYHGYGMLSMRTITEKYGGNISVEVNGNIFNLNIIFPR